MQMMSITCKSQINSISQFIIETFHSEQCKTEFCSSLCIKDELGEEGDKKGAWTSFFARAPMASDKCLDACYAGCLKKDFDEDD